MKIDVYSLLPDNVKDDIYFEKPFIPGLLPGDFCTYIFQYRF